MRGEVGRGTNPINAAEHHPRYHRVRGGPLLLSVGTMERSLD
jgi:hypothetical protein